MNKQELSATQFFGALLVYFVGVTAYGYFWHLHEHFVIICGIAIIAVWIFISILKIFVKLFR